MRKQAEPDIEYVLVQLRAELGRIAVSEMAIDELRSYGFRTMSEEDAWRVNVKQTLDSHGTSVSPDFSALTTSQARLEFVRENMQQESEPARAGFVTAVRYMRWRTQCTAETFEPLNYVPEDGHRGDHVALALSRLVEFWYQELRTAEIGPIFQAALNSQDWLRQLLINDAERPSTLVSRLDEDHSQVMEAVRCGLQAVDWIVECTDPHSRSEFWKKRVGQRAIDPRTRKHIWQLDPIERKRQAIISTTELLFCAIEDNEEIERLVPNGEGGKRRRRLARVRSQRQRFRKDAAKVRDSSKPV